MLDDVGSSLVKTSCTYTQYGGLSVHVPVTRIITATLVFSFPACLRRTVPTQRLVPSLQ